jgi:ankyrin repeat protein
MNLPPPPQDDDPIITQFKPVRGQWELNDDNIKRIDPESGHTILHNYCYYINSTPLEVYRYLIEIKGCDVNVQDEDNNTPLILALRYFKGRDITVLMYLLSQKGVNANIKCQFGYTLLHDACERINKLPFDIFKLLIEKLGCDVNAQDKDKDTPLHDALRRFDQNDGGNINVLIYLLGQKGINGNIKSEYGHTLLHRACISINALSLDVFKVLIETHGCDVNAQNDDKDTPLHFVLRRFNPESGNINVLIYLLGQKGINGDIKSCFCYTLLHEACRNINKLPLDIFKLLIETIGCDVNVQNKYDDTPIHRAIDNFNPDEGGDIKALAYLIDQKNVNFNIKDKKGRNSLHLACTNNLSESRDSAELNVECDTVLCQIVEFIAERCVQQVLDEITP